MIKNTFSYVYSSALVIADAMAILASFMVAYIVRVEFDNRPLVTDIPARQFVFIFLAFIPIWLFIFAAFGLYKQDVYRSRFKEFAQLIFGVGLGMLALIAFDWYRDESIFPARLVPLYGLALASALIIVERSIMSRFRQQLFKYGYGVSNVLIVGSSAISQELARLLQNTDSSGYRVMAMMTPRSLIPSNSITPLKDVNAALRYMKTQNVHIVIQTEQYADDALNKEIIATAQNKHIAYKFAPGDDSILRSNTHIELLANVPVVSLYQTPLIGWGKIFKRITDAIFSIIALIFFAPFLLIFALVLKTMNPRAPILFKHARVTRFGNTFNAYKLRSMYWQYCAVGKSEEQIFEDMGRKDLVKEWRENQKVTNDPRIMPIGKFVRKAGLDELPQLWNVIRGDISLVGPRPVTKEELERYAESSSLFLTIKPGITGLWQVSGRSEKSSYEERIALDLFYVQNWSFLLDLKIMYRTILVMVGGKGQ